MLIEFNGEDIGRLLASLRATLHKMEKNVARFGDDFDPVIGAKSLEGIKKTKALIHRITQEVQNERDRSRRPSDYQAERQAR